MIARNGTSNFERIRLDNPASAPTEATRLQEVEAMIAGTSPVGHVHSVADIVDFVARLRAEAKLYIVDGDTIVWADAAGGLRVAALRAKTGGGILVGPDGAELDYNSGVARWDHTHDQLHDLLTLAASSSIRGTFSGGGQRLQLEVLTGDGMRVGPSGVEPDFGSGAKQVAPGNHSHSELHAPASAVSTSSLTLTVSPGQVISGVVPLDADPGAGYGKVGVGTAGLRIPLGTASNLAASGNHRHPNATTAEDGFLSKEDKRRIDLYQNLLQITQSVSYTRAGRLPWNGYVGGRHRWGQAMQITNLHLTAEAGVSERILDLEVDGQVVDTIAVPGGGPGVEVSAFKALTAIHVAPDKYVRVKGESGVGTEDQQPQRIDVSLSVRASVAQPVRINAGGPAVTPFEADAWYAGGEAAETVTAVITSHATNPAPMAVYQSWRARHFDSSPLIYTFTGPLAIGIDHLVRLHFSENYFDNIGDQKFHLAVTGATSATASNYDILAQTSGAKFRAVIREFTVRPAADGSLEVRLTPVANGSGQFHCAICAIEIIPQQ